MSTRNQHNKAPDRQCDGCEISERQKLRIRKSLPERPSNWTSENELHTNETDDRGGLYLGTEYAKKRVTVAVVEVESDHPDDEELA